MEQEKKFTRTQIHENAMICIFQYLFYEESNISSKKPIEEIISDVMESPFDQCDLFFRAIIFETIKNKKEYIELIESKLTNWKFDRLCLTDQAILLLFTSELLNKRAEAQVAIDMAVDLAHKYTLDIKNEDNAYKRINKVLDRIVKENAR